MNSKLKFIFFVLLTLTISISLQNCNWKKKDNSSKGQDENSNKSDLIIFHSSNLNNPIDEVIKAFNKEHPEIKVSTEAGSVIQTVKKITEQKKVCDVFILSDYTQLDRFLFPEYANWSIAFAGNEMVIAYTDKSKMSKEINAKNWYKILLDKNIKYGRADKDSDVCGTRTVLMVKLAEIYYKQKGLGEKFAQKDKQFILPKVGGLLPMLNSNDIDYVFAFKSFAVMHNLKYISLPDEINFSNLDHIFLYSRVTFDKKGKNKARSHEVMGTPMLYGMTIPFKTPNQKNAMLFADFLLNPKKGLAIFEKLGNNIRTPIPTIHFGKIPAPLKQYVSIFDSKDKIPTPPDRGPQAQPQKK
jgi:molybdate/tungstate transport system substrate-binding protein